MSLELFLFLLLVVSVFTNLFTEAVKVVLKEKKVSYHANLLTGYVSVAVSVAAGIAYIILTSATINAKMMILLIALILLSWLSAMVGYDKVMQAISQVKIGKK